MAGAASGTAGGLTGRQPVTVYLLRNKWGGRVLVDILPRFVSLRVPTLQASEDLARAHPTNLRWLPGKRPLKFRGQAPE